jgi:hypothetical protein
LAGEFESHDVKRKTAVRADDLQYAKNLLRAEFGEQATVEGFAFSSGAISLTLCVADRTASIDSPRPGVWESSLDIDEESSFMSHDRVLDSLEATISLICDSWGNRRPTGA